MVALNIRAPAHERNEPRQPSKRDRMWSAIRQLRVFDPQKVALCTESTAEDARRFIAALKRTGYLVPADGRKSRLARNSGPKAPMLLWSHDDGIALAGVLDRNDGKAYGVDGNPAPDVSSHARGRAGVLKLRLKPRRRGRKAVAQ